MSIVDTEQIVGRSRFRRTACGVSALTFDSAYLGIAFCVLSTAYLVVQSFLTTLFPGAGFFSLALVYGFFGVCALLAPSLAQVPPIKGDARLAMCSASVLYIIFLVSVGVQNTAFLYTASVLLGLGSAILWVYQGVYLTSVASTEVETKRKTSHNSNDMEKYTMVQAVGDANGVFWFFVNISGIVWVHLLFEVRRPPTSTV